MRRLPHAALLLLALASACATVRYDYRPDVPSSPHEPDYAVRLAVPPFEIANDALNAHPGSPELPHLSEQLGRNLARAIRATGRFQSVVYLEETPPEGPDGWRELGERYGVDGFVVGRLDSLTYESWFAPWVFVPPFLPSLFPLGVLGVPLAPRKYAAEAAADIRLVSTATSRVCWQSERIRRDAKALHRVSWYTVSENGARLHERLFNDLFDDLRREAGLLIGRREIQALRGSDGKAAQFRGAVSKPLTTIDAPTTSTFRRRYALIVGISEYRYAGRAGLANLTWADDDARAFRRALLRCGWRRDDIRMLLNGEATRRNVERAVGKWLRRATENDLLVVYWAGHGYETSNGTKSAWLAFHDTDVARPETGWRMDRALAALERLKPRNAVIVADACHAEELGRQAVSRTRTTPPSLTGSDAVPPGWVFLMSARGDRRAAEHARWRGGLFTRCLVDALEGRADTDIDGRVTIAELRHYLNAVMPPRGRAVLRESHRPVVFTDTTNPAIWNLSLSPDGWEDGLDEWPHAALRRGEAAP